MPRLFVANRPFKHKPTEFYLSGLAVHLREEVALCVAWLHNFEYSRVSRGFLFPWGSNSHISNPFDHIQSIRRDLFDPRKIKSRCTICAQDWWLGFQLFFITRASNPSNHNGSVSGEDTFVSTLLMPTRIRSFVRACGWSEIAILSFVLGGKIVSMDRYPFTPTHDSFRHSSCIRRGRVWLNVKQWPSLDLCMYLLCRLIAVSTGSRKDENLARKM